MFFFKIKKQKQLTVKQKKDLKKISRFNKEVLKENLPDVFVLEKLQNNIPIFKQKSDQPVLLSEKSSDDSFFFGFLYFLTTLCFYTLVKIIISIMHQYFFDNCFGVVFSTLSEAPYVSIFNFFGSERTALFFRSIFLNTSFGTSLTVLSDSTDTFQLLQLFLLL